MYKYELKRSKRKTLSLQITKDCTVLVRAPKSYPKKLIDQFVENHTDWITIHLEKQKNVLQNTHVLSDDEINNLKRQAKEYIPNKVKEFAEIMGLEYGQIKITSAKTRYGSCNTKTYNLCFSYRLMLKPKEAVDYVIVHELAHIVHPNHSKDFYSYIEKYMPDYKNREKTLKNRG